MKPLSFFPFNLLSKPWNAHHVMMEMTMMPFLNFLAPLLSGLAGGAGTIASGLGAGVSGIGGLLGKGLGMVPGLGKGGLGLGKLLTNVTGQNGLGGLLGSKGMAGLLGGAGKQIQSLDPNGLNPDSLGSRAGHMLGGEAQQLGGGIGGLLGQLSKAPGLLQVSTGLPQSQSTNPNNVDPMGDNTYVGADGVLYDRPTGNPFADADLGGFGTPQVDVQPISQDGMLPSMGATGATAPAGVEYFKGALGPRQSDAWDGTRGWSPPLPQVGSGPYQSPRR